MQRITATVKTQSAEKAALLYERCTVEIIAWVAIAIAVGVGGEVQVTSHDEPFKDKAACEVFRADLAQRAETIDGLVAFGLSCAPVVVSNAHVKTPARPQQSDLEKSNDPAHASSFRSTAF